MSTTEPQRSPIEVEVLGDDVVQVRYGDTLYDFPASLDDAGADVLEAIDDRKLSYVVREILGADQYKKFKATNPKVRDYGLLFDEYAKQIGLISAGE